MPGESTGFPEEALSSATAETGKPGRASRIISRVTAPGRRMTTPESVTCATVDSRPKAHCPPSIIASTRPSISSQAISKLVGLTRPERLADGAAIGSSHRDSRRCAAGCEGMRMPTEPRPAVTASGSDAARGSTNIDRTARLSNALAPSPYTVSVGSTTRPPFARMRAAVSRLSALSRKRVRWRVFFGVIFVR